MNNKKPKLAIFMYSMAKEGAERVVSYLLPYLKNQDKNEMAKQIIRLIENKELRQTLGENALKSSNKFSVEKIGLKWENLFKEILNKS